MISKLFHDKKPRVIVVGASSGGTEAVGQLLQLLPKDLMSCVLVVRHLAPELSASYLARRLSDYGGIPCVEARDGGPIVPGRAFIAPADHHLLIDEDKLWVVHGARENRWRPSIDTLFRSAAVSHRNGVLGVVLSGLLDDGVAGMAAIKACGGITLVQDPHEAACPDLPRNVLRNVEVDHCLRVADLANAITDLVLRDPPAGITVPYEITAEARIAKDVAVGIQNTEPLGERTGYTCPDCGGLLWEVFTGACRHYRCHTGHSFGPATLLAAQKNQIEHTLWAALRMFEERKNLLKNMSWDARSIMERMDEADRHIDILRSLLTRTGVGEP
jgi:two-component system chemotaxis response regulator CheB